MTSDRYASKKARQLAFDLNRMDRMDSRELANMMLWYLLDSGFTPKATLWQEQFSPSGPDSKVFDRGLAALSTIVTADSECVLHGWMDQVYLDIVAIGPMASLRERLLVYRPDQVGDSGLLRLQDGLATILEFSFEASEAALRQYELPKPNAGASK